MKTSIKLFSAERAREELAKLHEEKAQEKERAEQRRKEDLVKKIMSPPPDLDKIAYEEMLEKVYFSIFSAIGKLKSSCDIRIGTQVRESEENNRKRKALETIKVELRKLGYQTSWSLNQIEDDGFNRDHYDEFSISWDPKIRWNQFRD